MKDSILIIGEGPTEYFFLNSLKDDYRFLQNIEPGYPKHTSVKELERKIRSGIQRGFSRILCMIDMDNKKEGKERTDYLSLKKKYHGLHKINRRRGIDCQVSFYETERCTELFFLYYFKYTTRLFEGSDDVVRSLKGTCGYAKSMEFFRKNPLHPYFISKGGSLKEAITNAEKSMSEAGVRGYSYSELGRMFKELGITC